MIRILFEIFRKDQKSIKYIRMPKTKKFLFKLGILGIILFSMFSIISPLIYNADQIRQAITIDVGIIALIVSLYISFIVAIIYSIGFLFSSMYLDKNLENYLYLPINRRDFIVAKLLLIYYNVGLISLLIVSPFVIFYLYFSNISFIILITLIIYLITMPIVTIALSAILVGTVIYFVNKLKNKKLAMGIVYGLSTLLMIFAYLFFVLKMTTVPEDDYVALYNALLSSIETISIVFTYPNLANDIILNSNYVSIFKMIIIVIVGLLFIFYFEKIYFKSSIGFNENTSSKRKKARNKLIKNYSLIRWFFIKEAKEIFKTGVYFFNTVFSNIFIVVLFLVMMAYNGFFGQQDLSSIYSFIEMIDLEIVILITIIVSTVFSFFNVGAATIFSREAKSLDILNSLPISKSKAIYGKLLFHGLIELLTLLFFFLPIMIYLNVSIINILMVIPVLALVVFTTLFIPAIIDLNFPNLDWESETAVVKTSRSIIISMIVNVILIASIIGFAYLMFFKLNVNYKIIAYIFLILYIAFLFILFKWYNKSIEKAFRKVIE